MLVSVLMSVYKEDSNYIRQAIDSILNQSYKDFEFVIVGDSPDSDRERVFALIDEYAKKDSRIVFIRNKENIGLPRSLNKGLAVCQGKYVARMDADDISFENRLEEQVKYMESNPNILASGAWADFIDKKGNKISSGLRYESNPQRVKAMFLQNSHLVHPLAIYHRVIEGNPIRYSENEQLKYAEDYDLWVRILDKGHISNIPKVLLLYRLSPNQITNDRKWENIQCSSISQRKAFKLYDINVSKSFLDVFYNITLSPNFNLSLEDIKEEIAQLIYNTRPSLENINAIESIVSAYDGYMTIRFHKVNPVCHILDVTKQSPFWSTLIISRYFYHRFILKCRMVFARYY